MSDNDDIYGKGILDNFYSEYRYEYPNKEGMPHVVETDWEPPE
jgi:hypothetical protein